MRNKIKYLLVAFLFCFISLNTVYATEDNCGKVQEEITKYNEYTKSLESLDCNDKSNESSVINCNDANLKRNLAVTNLMRYKEENIVCSSQVSEVDSIIKENENRCSKVLDDDFNNFVDKVMLVFYIISPILLILFGSIDYTKAVVSVDPDGLKKANKKFVKRLVATILIFLAPVITNFIISFNVSDYKLSGNAYACEYKYSVYTKKYTITNKPKKSKKSAVSGGNKVGDYILFGQSDPAWGSEPLIAAYDGTTIREAGCAVTSVAMAIANSGVETIEPINPSSFSKILKRTGNFGCDCGCCIVWSGTSAATNGKLVYEGDSRLTGNISNKASQIAELLNQGYHVVLQVKFGTSNSSHYVYVLYVDNGNIMVGEAWDGTLLNLNTSGYPIASGNYASYAELYKVVD